MATPEQIEAVVREIDGYKPYSSPYLLTKTDATRLAARAIAAYERARPVVPSDRELVQVFLEAKEARFRQGHSSSYDDNEAGIRAVRERLEEGRSTVPGGAGGWWGWNFAQDKWFPCLQHECRECVTPEGVIVNTDIKHRDERRDHLVRAVREQLEGR